MFKATAQTQTAMMLLVTCSSFLLGVSIGDNLLVSTSIVGTLTAFVLVDRLQWVELSGWFANLVSIGVLILTMRGFLGAGSAGKLVAVAYLLTYLLNVLMFQKKTPRLCWQLLVLSVLQTSLAAIFNLNFENGVIFIIYFVIAIIAMIMQNDFYQWSIIQWANQRNQNTASRHILSAPALVESQLPQGLNLSRRLAVAAPWLVGCLAFSFLLFHSLPHTRQQNDSAMTENFTATGMTWQNDLDVSGVLPISNRLIFRARYFDFHSNEKLLINNPPYFRGMALSRLVLVDGKTSWRAPYDHVFEDFSYSKLTRLHSRESAALRGAKRVGIDIIVEPTDDPLLYAPTPTYRKVDQNMPLEFDRDLSAITRKRARKSNQLTSFRYRLTTIVDSANRTLEAWPYRSFVGRRSDLPMPPDSPEHDMLTELAPEMYPQLVKAAQRVASEQSGAGRLALCRALMDELSQSKGFTYTLDYRNVEKDPDLDPVEDFFANHRSGHCAMFASSLALMLRSLDIPARYVVGYYGSNYNQLTECYVIHGRNAHAWVEVYLPPEECTQEMFEQGMAREGGAWLTLDATPEVNIENSNEALDLARSIWQDYVISPDANKQTYNGPGALQAGSLANSQFSSFVEWAISVVKTSKPVQATLIVAMILFAGWTAFRDTAPSRKRRKNMGNPIRKWIGSALSRLAPELGHRIQFGRSKPSLEIRFYQQLERILNNHLGLQRQANQTHREFAIQSSQALFPLSNEQWPHDQIAGLLNRVTNAFYQVRFGSIPLDHETIAELENQLKALDLALGRQVRKSNGK